MFCTYGANSNMVMFLESFSKIKEFEAVSYKQVACRKNMYYWLKLISLCSEKLDRRKYWQNLMSLNSKAKVCEN